MAKEPREFAVQLLDWDEIHEVPGAWSSERYLALLQLLEVDDVSEADAPDMVLMALQDLEPAEAAERILEVIFGDTMRTGIRRNLAHEINEERPWEDFADITQQAGIFDTVVLLQKAFPREYDKPDAAAVVVRLETASERGREWLDASAPDPALLLRILAAGMDDRSVLRRLFGEALAGSSFPEAGSILWKATRREGAEAGREFLLHSSLQWFEPLKHAESWTAKAWLDAPVAGEHSAD